MSENNGWIKCSERLPEIFAHNGLERSDVVMCFGTDCHRCQTKRKKKRGKRKSRISGFFVECGRIRTVP